MTVRRAIPCADGGSLFISSVFARALTRLNDHHDPHVPYYTSPCEINHSKSARIAPILHESLISYRNLGNHAESSCAGVSGYWCKAVRSAKTTCDGHDSAGDVWLLVHPLGGGGNAIAAMQYARCGRRFTTRFRFINNALDVRLES